MATNESRATLVNRYANQVERLDDLTRQQLKLREDMRETTEAILNDAAMTRALKETGVRVGHGGKVMRFDESLANTSYPLVVEELPEIPYSFQLDEVLDDE